MSRIGCNVTKDLLPGYLDETCSGEARELVEEHLGECESCRKFLAKLREEDAGKEELKLTYLNRARRFVDIQSLAGIFLPLLMLLTGFYGVNHSASFREVFYYIEMPVMMLICAYALGRGREKGLPSGVQWLIPVFGVMLVSAASVLRYFVLNKMTEFEAIMLQMRDSGTDDGTVAATYSGLGPMIHRGCLLIALAAAVLLIVLVILAKRKGKILTVSANLAWLALNMALTLDELLYSMVDLECLRRYMSENSLILVLEFLMVTALLFLLRRFGFIKRMELS